MTDTQRPLPELDGESAPYFAAAREHRFVLPRCPACGLWSWYPRAVCPHCHAAAPEWAPASGRGELYSWTVSRRPASPAFAGLVPYVVALVTLAEGPRMMSNLVSTPLEAVRIGMPLRVCFVPVSDDVTLPMFEPEQTGPEET